ncbi:MAG: NAD-dependent epimerase/dehydratase family protein [Pseudomonadota bacterium]
MTLLITGADGFTGRHLIAAAQSKGLAITALQSNLTDAAAVADEVSRVAPERVLHLAAISYVGHADPRAFYDVNLFGTLNLLAALAALPARPRQIVLASSANVYGNTPLSPIAEDLPPSPTNHYAMSKLAMEHMSRTFDLPLVLARPFNYVGPGQAPSFVVPKLVEHFRRRASYIELGNLDVEREFNDVRYVCDAYLQLLDAAPPGGVYNICSGRPYALRELIRSFSRLTGHEMEVRFNPEFARANEIARLCGDPARLHAVARNLKLPSLDETLAWILAS